MSSFSQVKKYSKPALWWWAVLLIGFVGLAFSWGDVGWFGYEVSKVVWVGWMVRALALIYVWQMIMKPQQSWRFDRILGLLILSFIVWVIVTSVGAGDWRHSIVGNFFRNDGLFAWLHLPVFSFLVAQLWQDKKKDTIAWALVWLGFLTSLSLFQLTIPPFQLGHGHPSLDAGVLTLTIPFTAYVFRHKKRLSLVAVQIAALIASEAWGAMLSMVVASLVMVVVFFKPRWLQLGWTIALGGVLLIGGVFFALHEYQPTMGDSSYFSESRVRIVTKLVLASQEKPWGWGWANVSPAFNAVDWPYPTNVDVYVDKAHSEWLEVLVATGLVGVHIYILFQVRVLQLLWRNTQRSKDKAWALILLFAAITYIVHSQTNIVSISEQAMFWLLVGLAARIDNPTRSSYALNAPNKK